MFGKGSCFFEFYAIGIMELWNIGGNSGIEELWDLGIF